jgi:thiol-disulfide isomerase/thioredoxin
MKNTLLFTIAIIVAGSSGYFMQRYLQPVTNETPNPAVGIQRVEFAAADLDGTVRNIAEWDGKIIFLNFWATWCPPCKEEIPHFIDLQQSYGAQGLQFIGIAIDELNAVRSFADSMGINYPTLVAESDGVGLAQRYGNGAGVLPYTVIINRDGEISHTVMGLLSKERAETLLEAHGIDLE